MNHLNYTEGYLLTKKQIKNNNFISARSTFADIEEKGIIWFDTDKEWEAILKAVDDHYPKK